LRKVAEHQRASRLSQRVGATGAKGEGALHRGGKVKNYSRSAGNSGKCVKKERGLVVLCTGKVNTSGGGEGVEIGTTTDAVGGEMRKRRPLIAEDT